MIFSSRISLLLFFMLVSALSQAQSQDFVPVDSISGNPALLIPLTLHDSIIDYGKLFLNTPYRYGSKGDKSFDCSGFTTFVFNNFGYNLERSSADQAEQAPAIRKEELKKGDLVFFEGRRRNGKVGHVGIVVETRDSGNFDFIHAAVKSGVTISNSRESYYAPRFVKAGRIIGADSVLQRLKCSPDYADEKSANTLKTQNKTSLTIPAVYHKVRKGENLSSIASKHGVSTAQLKKMNDLKSTSLQINQRLKIKEKVTVKVPERGLAQQKSEVEKPENVSTKDSVEIVDNTVTDVIEISGKHTNEQSAKSEKADKNTTVPKMHKVTKGESLYSIARAHNTTVDKLKEINNITNGKIMPGQKLMVSVNNTEFSKTENQSEKLRAVEHTVQTGESLFSIARMYNVSVENIRSSNNLFGTKIKVGQVLTIYNAHPVL